MGKVSIIIAAYNIENYIYRCLESIVNQTYKNLEIIIVNDGSKDRTLDIINTFASEDNRIIIINQENKGLSNSRKIGYTKATGEYLLFVDGDDWLEENAVEILYDQVKYNKSDIVCFNYIDDNGRDIINVDKYLGDIEEYNNEDFLKNLLLGRISPTIWSKFIRRGFIEDNNVNWPKDINYAEDVATSCSLAINRPNVIKVNSELYHYYKREGSITNQVTDKVLDINNAIIFIKEELINKELFNKYITEFSYLVFMHNYYCRINIISKFNNKYSKILYDIWKSYDISMRKNKYIMSRLLRENMGQRFYMNLLDKNYKVAKMYFRIRGFSNES